MLAFFQFLETEEPVPSLADVAYLAFYPCLAAGLLSFPGAPRDWSERRNLGLDALIALIGGTMVIWYLVVGPAVRSDEGFLAVVLGVAHPVGGFLFGGSGTVVCGAERWLADHDASDLTAVAIAPDLGERYLDTVYHTNWVQGLYGEGALSASPSSEERHAVPLG